MNNILHFSALEEVLRKGIFFKKSKGKTFLYGKLFLNLSNKRLVRGERSNVELSSWYPIPPVLYF